VATSEAYVAIYAAVGSIPAGRVATYGQIAALAGLPNHARQVGYALHALSPGDPVPWHRVVNAKGEISQRSSGGGACEDRQRLLLQDEDIPVDARGRVDLKRFRWSG
jgi:methylated-DNA-protein-cysteine methyltransferase related protein